MASGMTTGVLKYEGDNSTFVWKHPTEDFVFGTQLFVHENQEALFFMNGQALDLFGPGRYTLETQNLPIARKFFKAPTDGKTPFHCEVYFINKTERLTARWGTDTKLEYMEPTYNFPIQIGASGEMILRVEDSRKLLIKVVGNEKVLTQQSLMQKFRSYMVTEIKNHFISLIKKEKISIFDIDEYLKELSETLHKTFVPEFLKYGVALEKFLITAVVKPEDDRSFQKFKELYFRKYADVEEARLRQKTGVIEQETKAKRIVIEAEAIAQKRALEGYTYQDKRGFDVAEKLASNEAVGQMTNTGIGLGLMTGVGGTVGTAVGGIVQDTIGSISGGTPCTECGTLLPKSAKFCMKCGNPMADETTDEGKV